MNVVSFGGGTNSTAMIVGMYLHKIPVDLILFADPGAEQPHTYEYIEVFDECFVCIETGWRMIFASRFMKNGSRKPSQREEFPRPAFLLTRSFRKPIARQSGTARRRGF